MVDINTRITTTTSTTSTTTTASIDPDTDPVTASREPDKMEQNPFVIPSHELSRCQASATSISDSGKDIDIADNELAYEPCYKPYDIFAIYQNRLCFQGKRIAFHFPITLICAPPNNTV